MIAFDSRNIDIAIKFTEAYREYENAHVAIREAMCLKAQYPAILTEIQDGDLFAGRSQFSYVGFKYSFLEGETGYFCDDLLIAAELEKGEVPESVKKTLTDLKVFWKGKTTLDVIRNIDKTQFPSGVANALMFPGEGKDWKTENYIASYGPRIAEVNINFDMLLKLGIPGMKSLIGEFRDNARHADKNAEIYEAMLMVLDLFTDICRYYADDAKNKAFMACDEKRKKELLEMADVLERLASNRPETLREGIQLFWLYSILAFVDNFGRMDLYLGDFYACDIDSGRITEAEALAMMESLFGLINSMYSGCGRIIIGGSGRPNVENADRFAMLAMDTVKVFKWVFSPLAPQVSLRIYKGMNPALLDKAVDTIALGSTSPFLYNDDVNIPQIAEAYGVSIDEARQYIMSNCGEYSIDHRSYGSPAGTISYPKALEVTINNGYDPLSQKPMGLKTGEFKSFKTFEDLLEAFEKQVGFFAALLADKVLETYQITDKNSCHLFAAMLFDDCLEEGKGFISGAKYLGIDMEAHGLICVADSLMAIKALVFDNKLLTAEELQEALRADFKGFEKAKRLMLDAPKYGNDDDEADKMAVDLFRRINSIVGSQAERIGIHFCVASHISVDGYVHLGKLVGATPDGRHAFKPYTNSVNPIPGNDRKGITALLNSMVKIKPGHSGGQVNHIKLGRDMFTANRRQLEALIISFFENGGGHLCIEVLNREDLKNAFLEPEKYPNLMVRVGGFSARFVTLPREVQEDILARTHY